MAKIRSPRLFIALMEEKTLDAIFKTETLSELKLEISDYYQSAFNKNYQIVEIQDLQDEPERPVDDIYLLVGALAIHETDTSGVFIDSADVEKINDGFGYNGGGTALLYSLLSQDERLSLMKEILEKRHPLLKTDEMFLRELNLDNPYYDDAADYEDWESIEDCPNLFNDCYYECRSSDGYRLLTFGTGSSDMEEIIANSGLQCYIFNCASEEESKKKNDNIEILDFGDIVEVNPDTGEVTKPQVPLLPPPNPYLVALDQYSKGLITEEELNSRRTMYNIDKAIDRLKELNYGNDNYKDKEAIETKRELNEIWNNFPMREDEYYGD